MKLWIVLVTAGILLMPALSYAQSSESAVTTTIGYFYSSSGQMIDAEDNSGAMSSYLTRGERYNGTSETFAVSNIKDITADLDSSGNVLNKYTYTAYGTHTSYPSTSKIIDQTLSINENPFTYSGYYTDGESGNYYLNARYYDPTLGIFLTSDSYNLPNRYMYVSGNPVMSIDPTGHVANFCGAFHLGWENGQFHNGWGNWEDSNAYQTLHPQMRSQNGSQDNIIQEKRASQQEHQNNDLKVQENATVNKENLIGEQKEANKTKDDLEMEDMASRITDGGVKRLVVDLDQNIWKINKEGEGPNSHLVRLGRAVKLEARVTVNARRMEEIRRQGDAGVDIVVATSGTWEEYDVRKLFQDYGIVIRRFNNRNYNEEYVRQGINIANKVDWMDWMFGMEETKMTMLMDDDESNIEGAKALGFSVYQTRGFY